MVIFWIHTTKSDTTEDTFLVHLGSTNPSFGNSDYSVCIGSRQILVNILGVFMIPAAIMMMKLSIPIDIQDAKG